MKALIHKRKKLILGIGIPVLAAVLLCAAFLIYTGVYYHADTEAIERAFPSVRGVSEQTLDNGDLVVSSMHAKVGLIFYPGGKVEHTAYLPLMRALAKQGVCCVLVKMPLRLAVLELHAADGVREALPNVTQWYIGGHSLGGTIAASELAAHRGTYEGLLLLASFSTDDLSNEPVRALSIYGSEDGVLNRETYEKNRKNLPADTTELVIEGGCHAYFGMYGAQAGDGTPSISDAEQIRITADAVIDWIQNGSRQGS